MIAYIRMILKCQWCDESLQFQLLLLRDNFLQLYFEYIDKSVIWHNLQKKIANLISNT